MEQEEDEDELSQMDIDEEHNLDTNEYKEYKEHKENDEINEEELNESSDETDEGKDEVEKHPKLDDKFFNLSEFNKTTEENEKFEDSDEEIDYFAGLFPCIFGI